MSDEFSNISITDIPTLPETCLIYFKGVLDGKSMAAIDACINQLMGGNKKHAIADLSGVSLVTSGALGKLLGIKRRFIDRGGDLVLAAMNLDLKMKLALMGANKIFKIYGDIRSATSAYAWEIKHETEHVELSFPSNLRMVPGVRRFVSQVMRQKGYSDRDSFRIETIVDEICNNAVQYGSHKGNENINLRISVDWDKVEIDAENVSDPKKIESLKLHMKSLQEHQGFEADEKRGRGLALVKMLASKLTADVSDKGTMVHVTKLKEE